MSLYRMCDLPEGNKAALPVRDVAEARKWNTPEHAQGIFITVNSFAGARRKENLTRIEAWAIDMDDGTKQEQAKRIMSSPLVPSVVVETKRGYQVYWVAQAGARAALWNKIVLERLVPFFGSDKNARDLCRILRAPGFLHLKDPADPFLCQAVWKQKVAYSEWQIYDAFPWVPDEKSRSVEHSEHKQHARAHGVSSGESFWDAVYNLDCRDALQRLSGTGSVNGENFTFRRCSSGNLNILVDGKGTSCWIDTSGRIGSMSKGGPTVYAWLHWYGAQPAECVRILKDLYPHLADIDERAKGRAA